LGPPRSAATREALEAVVGESAKPGRNHRSNLKASEGGGNLHGGTLIRSSVGRTIQHSGASTRKTGARRRRESPGQRPRAGVGREVREQSGTARPPTDELSGSLLPASPADGRQRAKRVGVGAKLSRSGRPQTACGAQTTESFVLSESFLRFLSTDGESRQQQGCRTSGK
jgi:hypothetical protein